MSCIKCGSEKIYKCEMDVPDSVTGEPYQLIWYACEECGHEQNEADYRCPHCQSNDVHLVAGEIFECNICLEAFDEGEAIIR